jgi:ACT domain-containing protein
LLPEITGLRTSLHASTNPQIRPCPHAFAESQQHPNSPGNRTACAIVTIIGSDRVGIIAGIANVIAEANVNILDISQSVIREFFTMIMMVDLSAATISFEALADNLARKGANLGVKVEIQREEIFKAMHRI